MLIRCTSCAPFAVTRAVIGRDDDQCLVVRPYFAEPQYQFTDQTVHVPDLREMSLVKRICVCGARSFEQPPSLLVSGLVVRSDVPASRRHVFELHMRQHRVHDVQACRLTVNRRQELREEPTTAVRDFARRCGTRPAEV